MVERVFDATGLLFRVDEGPTVSFLGTCFLYRRRTHVLTAGHCVRGLEPNGIVVGLRGNSMSEVQEIIRHPNADIAVLVIEEPKPHLAQPLRGGIPISPVSWGTTFHSLGFPEDSSAEGKLSPTVRYFRGHVQRFFDHVSHMGYRYKAGEMSIGAPAGLSGGPIVADSDLAVAIGIVAENVDSTTQLSVVQEVDDGGKQFSERIHRVIQYGIFVHLDPLSSWLDSVIPPLVD